MPLSRNQPASQSVGCCFFISGTSLRIAARMALYSFLASANGSGGFGSAFGVMVSADGWTASAFGVMVSAGAA